MKKNAIKILLGMLIVVILFHLSILTKLIPYEITWGGRLQNDSEMYVFEALSILVNLFLAFALLMKGAYLRFYLKERVVNIILWVYFGIFVLNTIGNSFAKTSLEKSFALLTLLSAILIWLILKPKSKQEK